MFYMFCFHEHERLIGIKHHNYYGEEQQTKNSVVLLWMHLIFVVLHQDNLKVARAYFKSCEVFLTQNSIFCMWENSLLIVSK